MQRASDRRETRDGGVRRRGRNEPTRGIRGGTLYPNNRLPKSIPLSHLTPHNPDQSLGGPIIQRHRTCSYMSEALEGTAMANSAVEGAAQTRNPMQVCTESTPTSLQQPLPPPSAPHPLPRIEEAVRLLRERGDEGAANGQARPETCRSVPFCSLTRARVA